MAPSLYRMQTDLHGPAGGQNANVGMLPPSDSEEEEEEGSSRPATKGQPATAGMLPPNSDDEEEDDESSASEPEYLKAAPKKK